MMGASFLTIPKVAEKSGLPRDYIRAACWRGKDYHPLPHIRSGEKRPVIRINYSQFEQWLEEETSRQK